MEHAGPAKLIYLHSKFICAPYSDPAVMLACGSQWLNQKLAALRLTKGVLQNLLFHVLADFLISCSQMPSALPASQGCCIAGLLCKRLMYSGERRCGKSIPWLVEVEQVPVVQASDKDEELADSFAWRHCSASCHHSLSNCCH